MGEARSGSSPRRIQVRPPSWVIQSSTVAGPLGPASSTAYWSLNFGLSTSSVRGAAAGPAMGRRLGGGGRCRAGIGRRAGGCRRPPRIRRRMPQRVGRGEEVRRIRRRDRGRGGRRRTGRRAGRGRGSQSGVVADAAGPAPGWPAPAAGSQLRCRRPVAGRGPRPPG